MTKQAIAIKESGNRASGESGNEFDPGIIWLASYPKSGNTWLRAFLANFRKDEEEPVDINALGGGPISSARQMFDEYSGVSSSDLTADEIDRLRPDVYEQMVQEAEETPIFMKAHDAFTYTRQGVPVISKAATIGAIYLIRNPFDVAVSYAHHCDSTVDKMIPRMGKADHSMVGGPKRLHNQLRQRLLTWSEHVLSWVDEPDLRVHVMRYEDMCKEPLETFRAAVCFAGFDDDAERIERALENSSFKKLREQERDGGFREKMPGSESFFRKGKVGSWREVLTDDQTDQVVKDHGEVMRRFGYISDDGRILV